MYYAAMLITALALGADAQPAAGQPAPHQLRRAVHAALRQSAPRTQPNVQIVAPQLIALLDQVNGHPAMTPADRTRYQGLLKARLQALAKQLKKDLPKQRPAQPLAPDANGDARPHILAQQAGNPPAAGANNVQANANANRGGNRDITTANAQQLVELIERTIAPTTWESAGGLGTIRYYSPLRVLVIRQTGDVHDQLGGLIGGLNK